MIIIIYIYIIHDCMCVGQTLQQETRVDKLRSILAQLEFAYVVSDFDQRGVLFRTHLHVPEVHPITGHSWYEREDPAHVLKVHVHVQSCMCIYSHLYKIYMYLYIYI